MKEILKFAQKLALEFSDDTDIPGRFKDKYKKKGKNIKQDSCLEQRFQKNVNIWKAVIETMLLRVNNEKAWRFILLSPQVEPQLKSVVYSQDFMDFTDYFILRRDIDQCDCNELGFLSMLYTEFQRKIEGKIQE
jgi:hypothetical protein